MLKPRSVLFFLLSVFAGVTRGEESPSTADLIPVSEDYVLRTWEVDAGLPSNHVWGIAQTADGYLWLATSAGLARFDGVRFTVFTKESTPGLESNRIATVLAAGNGDLWVGLERGGVARKQGNRFESIVPVSPSPAPVAWITSFAEDAAGAIWFGHASVAKVARWQAGRISEFSAKEGVGPGVETYVRADKAGKIWFSTKDACGLFDGTFFCPVDPEGGERPMLAPSREGGMWATRNKQLLRYRADGSREMVADMGKIASVTVLFEDRGGDLWIGTRNAGLFRFREGHFVRVIVSHIEIAAIEEDREGNLWVGTMGGGLNRLRPSRFHLRQTKHGLSHDNIASLCEDTEGRLWVVGRDGVPVRSLDESHEAFTTPPGWPGGAVMTVCPDASGGVWLGTINAGLLRWQNGAFSYVKMWEKITALLLDGRGSLWAATLQDAVICRRGNKNTYMPVTGGLVAARALAEDRTGRLWVGTDAGLIFQRMDGQPFTCVPLPGATAGRMVQFIVPDQADTMWIGVLQSGLYRWRAGKVTRMPLAAGLPLDDLRSLVIDPEGDFWIGTVHGLLRVPRSEIDAVMDGQKSKAEVVAYGRGDGLPNAEFSLGFRNAGIRTRDGHLWFATTRGALEITPRPARAAAPLAPVLIEGFQAGDMAVPVDGAQNPKLPPRPGPIRIFYTLPHLSTPEQLCFRYRLKGWGEEEWISAGDERTATFAHLPPGDYRFEVAAAEGLSWLPATASIAFTVRPAWWETLWFYWGMGLLGALLLAVIVRLFVKRRMQARMRGLERENALEKERARISRDMHDRLGANLTELSLFAGLVQAESGTDGPVADHAARVMLSARKAVAALDEIVWAVNPRNDTLPRLLEYLGQCSADFLHAAGIRCRLDFPADIPSRPLAADFRHNLFLIVQEALNNVVKHAAAREVRLHIEAGDAALVVEIADDGRGLPESCGSTDSNGLTNLAERASALGGTCEIESRPGCGTCLKFHLPWPD
ncbi:MAG: hypothetical protein JF599_06415 [Verrucomicrobia bacterium]|nr:hypothetical protein [Verrucomicrobiota bacterium]